MAPTGRDSIGSPVTEAELHAWLDGELPPDRAAEVERHLQDHPEDLRRLESYRGHADLIAAAYAPLAAAPVAARLPPVPAPPRSLWLAPFGAVAAAFLLFLAGTAAGWMARSVLPAAVVASSHHEGDTASVAMEAVSAHTVFATDIRHPVEVGADQETHLAAWLSRRLGVPVTVPKLDGTGFTLLGGRLLASEDGPAGQFMYEDPYGRRITIYICRAEEEGQTPFRLAEIDGISTLYWHERALWWAVAGDIERATLNTVAHTAYAALSQ
jgi:anti-sigma factor RsiW